MSSSRFTSLRSCLCIVAALLLSNVGVAEIIDQVNSPGGITYFANNNLDLGQTFTIGLDGQLTRIDLFFRRDSATTADLEFDIRTLTGPSSSDTPSEPDAGGNILATGFWTAASISDTTAQWYSFDISADNVFVSSGDVLAIALTNTDANEYFFAGDVINPYSTGQTFLRVGPGTWGDDPFDGKDVDIAFRTYVTVPEPSSMVVIAMLGGLVGIRRRRK